MKTSTDRRAVRYLQAVLLLDNIRQIEGTPPPRSEASPRGRNHKLRKIEDEIYGLLLLSDPEAAV